MQKTKKSVSKRVKLTRTGKMMRRTMGVDHFKTNQQSKVNRHKRSKRKVKSTDARILRKYLPHHPNNSKVDKSELE